MDEECEPLEDELDEEFINEAKSDAGMLGWFLTELSKSFANKDDDNLMKMEQYDVLKVIKLLNAVTKVLRKNNVIK